MLSTEFSLEDALKIRYEEGVEKGMEKGREQDRLQIARKMIKKGNSPEEIAEITELPMETIRSIE
jgi:predicted transposase/invertase (TIGR01784 family)